MTKTYLSTFVNSFLVGVHNALNIKINLLSLSVLCMLLGFFISTTLSTIPGQTGDWGIVGASIIVATYEKVSKQMYYYNQPNGYLRTVIYNINSIKIGIIYGLFVDAFKLGS
uniref:hypothetical protein ycf20 n=1 Tax=Nemalion vermiculare TaxID=935621 RepID=UPI00257A56ED|nr:hypothetical protein ycf20 [Nemalion vermiculare]WGV34437.1 hypothetical protein ycf20 [Nemalion vermiculare]